MGPAPRSPIPPPPPFSVSISSLLYSISRETVLLWPSRCDKGGEIEDQVSVPAAVATVGEVGPAGDRSTTVSVAYSSTVNIYIFTLFF